MLDTNLLALILVPALGLIGLIVDRIVASNPERLEKLELDWWMSPKALQMPVKPTDWETFEREIEWQLDGDPWKKIDQQDTLYRLERDMSTPREEDAAKLMPYRPRHVDVDDRDLHRIYCNRSPENQKRGMTDICNCPRAQEVGDQPASVDEWLEAATEYNGILLPEEKDYSRQSYGLWQVHTNRETWKSWVCPNCLVKRPGPEQRCQKCGHGISPDAPTYTDDAGRILAVINGHSEYVTRDRGSSDNMGFKSVMMPPLVCNKCLHELSGYAYHEHELHKQCGGRAMRIDSLTGFEKRLLEQVQAGIITINEARTQLEPNSRFPD